jgi:hypothetical protein
MADELPVTFSKADASRIDNATQYYERTYRGGGASPDGRTPPQVINRYARASGGIGAASGTGSTRTLGSGNANLCSRSGGTLTELADLVQVWNMFDTAIDDNSWLKISWTQGGWEIDKIGDCDNL